MSQPGESVIIIGGGIIGIACAHYLSRAGYGVTVIEQGTVAGACSHGNCGYIAPSHVLPLTTPEAIGEALRSLFNPKAAFRVKPRADPAFLKWLWQFARRCNRGDMLSAAAHLHAILQSSAAEYAALLSDDPMDSQWRKAGLLYVFETEEGLAAHAEEDRLLTEHFGVSARRIEGAELPQFDGALRSGLAGGFLYEDDTSVRADRLSKGWRRKLEDSGVQFIEHCSFEGLEKSGPIIRNIETSCGPMQADHYVLATGAVSTRLARHFGARLPIQPGKGYSITMKAPDNGPRHPMLLPEHHVGITPFDDGFRLGSMMEFVGYDTALPTTRLQQLRSSAQPYLRDELPATNLEEWYGWRPMTWDSLPVIGPVPGMDNALFATGHNMLGMTLAPATGRLIAEMVAGQVPHIDPTPYSPKRFN